MFYETSRKDIFESSGPVNLDSSPKNLESNDLASTFTMTTGLNQTSARTNPKSELQQKLKKEPFCSLFVIFGLNASKFVQNDFEETYDVLGSYPNLDKNPDIASEHKFVQDL